MHETLLDTKGTHKVHNVQNITYATQKNQVLLELFCQTFVHFWINKEALSLQWLVVQTFMILHYNYLTAVCNSCIKNQQLHVFVP